MKKFLFLIMIIWPLHIVAQEHQLFEAPNYQNAVKKGTRSRDGKPGLNYWQNHADYDISVKLNPAEKKIYGKENVIYYNESPDTITGIVLRLYKNRYKADAERNLNINEKNIHEGMNIDTLIINKSAVSLSKTEIYYNGTNMLIFLDEPLAPYSSLELYCEWNYPIASESEFRRSGYYKDNAWFIAYFYPQIAVYDDLEDFYFLKGWDFKLFHKGLQEFYNDFNTYKVKIEVPEDFFVWATGELKNSDEVYSKSIIQKLNKAKTTNEIVHIVSKDDRNKKNLSGNIWKFEARNVPDFAFGTALNYLWDGTSVQLEDKRVFVDVAYHPASKLYPKTIDIARRTVWYASNDFPKIQFPYSHATTFNGMLSGGMEFPMIANDSQSNDSINLYDLVAHELFHNYFPFMMGINEKRYGFMDEGFAIIFSYKFLCDYFENSSDYKFYGFSNGYSLFEIYEYFYKHIEDHTSIYNSYAQIDNQNFFFLTYIKPAVALLLYIEMLGEDKFLFALKAFVSRWQGKHPTPYDYFYTMNDVLHENYNWFWQAWYFEPGHADLGLSLQENNLFVQNVGGYPVPIELIVEYKDGTSKKISKSMNVWQNREKQIKLNVENFKNVKSVQLITDHVPDTDINNNYLEF